MSALTIAITVGWVVFWVYWLISAARAKQSSQPRRTRPPGLFIAILLLLVLHAFKLGTLAVSSPAVQIAGASLFLAGLGLAVWARIFLGRNWGMPMTQKDEPELVTSGPYRYVRHPIYSGILLAMLGTALATSLYWLLAVGVLGIYFIYSATVEEKLMTASFPATYPSYRTRTKMLIPFVL
jgi:protein-S-isoprenylcysteine O-methyltransferase Ste14